MSIDSRLNEIINALHEELEHACRDAELRGYQRGQADAKSEILAVLQSKIVREVQDVGVNVQQLGLLEQHVDSVPPTGFAAAIPADDAPEAERKRAPKGLPQKLVDRVLGARNDGVTPKDIAAAAETNNERMIKESTIRGELRKGRVEGRYEERNKRWYRSLH